MRSIHHHILPYCPLLLTLYACAVDLSVPSSSVDIPPVAKHRGVNFTSARSFANTTFDPLLHNNVDWIALTPTCRKVGKNTCGKLNLCSAATTDLTA